MHYTNPSDYDLDDLRNWEEPTYGTDPFDPDTDGDGLLDGDEVKRIGSSPTDTDSDDDSFEDGVDNCPADANADQADLDGDNIGDVCDFDIDGDDIGNTIDNCPVDANEDQFDLDMDGLGDVCDNDTDNDSILDEVDNCPTYSNPDQADQDGDNIGDPCDPDADGDGVGNIDDNCPLDLNPDQEDLDSDTIGDVCDLDMDGDTVNNDLDNCPAIANADQADEDSDGEGDVCDVDADNDGVEDADDNCLNDPNADQSDVDDDGAGDVCDADADNDTIDNEADNCPLVENADQADFDDDGLGDVCDPDADNDGAPDVADNCPLTVNADQSDVDNDDLGDACDPDADDDGIDNEADNCPLVENLDQLDTDDDGAGDVCDADADNDGIDNDADNCPLVGNPDQADFDEDGEGDVCDVDADNDGIDNELDNCPLNDDPNQRDTDNDGAGNVCDADDDGDTIDDSEDNCPLIENLDQLDTDSDDFGNACDSDDDNDTIFDTTDNCPLVENPDQLDTDGDAIGDVCDTDADGDGIDNETDNCPLVDNDEQADVDGDGLGDLCDPDADDDGILNEADNCPLDANPDQANADGDTLGDACESGPASQTNSTVTYSDEPVAADGEDSYTVTVTVRDADDKPVNNVPVRLASQNALFLLTPLSGLTDHNGQFVTEVTSTAVASGIISVFVDEVEYDTQILAFTHGDPTISVESEGAFEPNGYVFYRIQVSNLGTMDARDLTITAGLPLNRMTFVDEEHPEAATLIQQSNNIVQWQLPGFASTEIVEFVVVGQVAGSTTLEEELTFGATIETAFDANPSNNETTLTDTIDVPWSGPTGGSIQPQSEKLSVSYEPSVERAFVGDSVTFSVHMTNTSDETLYNVRAFADLANTIGSLSQVTWANANYPGRLLTGESATAQFTTIITPDFPNLASFPIVAKVLAYDHDVWDGRPYVTHVDTITDSELDIQGPGFTMTLQQSPDVLGGVTVGDTVTFTATIRNHANRTDSGRITRLYSYLLGTEQTVSPQTVLLPGGVATASFDYVITQNDVPRLNSRFLLEGEGVNFPAATFSFEDMLGYDIQPSETADPDDPDLALTLPTLPGAIPGLSFPLSYTVVNNGVNTANNVMLTVDLPLGVFVDEASLGTVAVYDVNLHRITWNLGVISSNQERYPTATLLVSSAIQTGVQLSFPTSVSAFEPDIDYSNNTGVLQLTTMTQAPSSDSTLLPVDRVWVIADGEDAITFEVTALDILGNPLPNVPVSFATANSGLVIQPAATVTDANGKLQVAVSATAEGQATLTADLGTTRISYTFQRRANGVRLVTDMMSVGVGGSEEMNLIVQNVSLDGGLFDLSVTGLESLDASWFDFVPSTVALTSGEIDEATFNVSIPTAQCDVVGSYPFSIQLTRQGGGEVGHADGMLMIQPSPPQLERVTPAAGSQQGGDEIFFSWRSNTPGEASIFWRPAGGDVPIFAELALTQNPNDTQVYSTSLPLDLGDYEWYGRMVTDCGETTFGSETAPIGFSVVEAISFDNDGYTFNIRDDYNQNTDVDGNPLAITVTNTTAFARQVQLNVDNPHDDLILGFIGSGSIDEAAILAAGESRQFELRVFTQHVDESEYTLNMTLESQGVMDVIPLTLAIQPAIVDIDLQILSVDPLTRVHTIELTNNGDTLTDFSLDMVNTGTMVPANVFINPQMDHAYFRTGTSLTVQVMPLALGQQEDNTAQTKGNFASLAGSTNSAAGSRVGPINPVACAGQTCISFPVDIDANCEIQHVPVVREEVVEVEILKKDWYCTNRPNIGVVFAIPFFGIDANITDASVTVSFSDGDTLSDYSHGTKLDFNGQTVGEVQVPDQSEVILDVSASLDPLGTLAVLQLYSEHDNEAHYIVSSEFQLQYTIENAQRIVCEPDTSGGTPTPTPDGSATPSPTPDGTVTPSPTPSPTLDPDGDEDDDGVPNNEDNCPVDGNPDQADSDGDGIGDACDNDLDGDGIYNVDDNCPHVYNPSQVDSDGNGIGDNCDGTGGGSDDTVCLVQIEFGTTLYHTPRLAPEGVVKDGENDKTVEGLDQDDVDATELELKAWAYDLRGIDQSNEAANEIDPDTGLRFGVQNTNNKPFIWFRVDYAGIEYWVRQDWAVNGEQNKHIECASNDIDVPQTQFAYCRVTLIGNDTLSNMPRLHPNNEYYNNFLGTEFEIYGYARDMRGTTYIENGGDGDFDELGNHIGLYPNSVPHTTIAHNHPENVAYVWYSVRHPINGYALWIRSDWVDEAHNVEKNDSPRLWCPNISSTAAPSDQVYRLNGPVPEIEIPEQGDYLQGGEACQVRLDASREGGVMNFWEAPNPTVGMSPLGAYYASGFDQLPWVILDVKTKVPNGISAPFLDSSIQTDIEGHRRYWLRVQSDDYMLNQLNLPERVWVDSIHLQDAGRGEWGAFIGPCDNLRPESILPVPSSTCYVTSNSNTPARIYANVGTELVTENAIFPLETVAFEFLAQANDIVIAENGEGWVSVKLVRDNELYWVRESEIEFNGSGDGNSRCGQLFPNITDPPLTPACPVIPIGGTPTTIFGNPDTNSGIRGIALSNEIDSPIYDYRPELQLVKINFRGQFGWVATTSLKANTNEFGNIEPEEAQNQAILQRRTECLVAYDIPIPTEDTARRWEWPFGDGYVVLFYNRSIGHLITDGINDNCPGDQQGKDECHAGIDLPIPGDESKTSDYPTLLASASGEVVMIGSVETGTTPSCSGFNSFGNFVIIEYPEHVIPDFYEESGSIYVAYAHLFEVNTDLGRIEKDDLIGRADHTGFSTGPHLHLEIRRNLNGVCSFFRSEETTVVDPINDGIFVEIPAGD